VTDCMDDWLYGERVAAGMTVDERHPGASLTPTDSQMALVHACNAFRQARLRLDADSWEIGPCDPRDHYRAAELLGTIAPLLTGAGRAE
jgi:hypothetical protein